MSTWIENGTVSVTTGSAEVTGVGTDWNLTHVIPGYAFYGPDKVLYHIQQVVSTTNIVLSRNYAGPTLAAQPYSIIQLPFAANSDMVQHLQSYIASLATVLPVAGRVEIGAPTVHDAALAVKGGKISFENIGDLAVIIAKASLTDTAFLKFVTGVADKARLGLDGADTLKLSRVAGGVAQDVFSVAADRIIAVDKAIQLKPGPAPENPQNGMIWLSETGKLMLRQDGLSVEWGQLDTTIVTAAWGAITGNATAQADLMALLAKRASVDVEANKIYGPSPLITGDTALAGNHVYIHAAPFAYSGKAKKLSFPSQIAGAGSLKIITINLDGTLTADETKTLPINFVNSGAGFNEYDNLSIEVAAGQTFGVFSALAPMRGQSGGGTVWRVAGSAVTNATPAVPLGFTLQMTMEVIPTLKTIQADLHQHVVAADPHPQYATDAALAGLATTVSNLDTVVSGKETTGVAATLVAAHDALTDNPHSVTKAQVGLGNVNNTADTDKPVSTAQAAAIAEKAPLSHTHAISDIPTLAQQFSRGQSAKQSFADLLRGSKALVIDFVNRGFAHVDENAGDELWSLDNVPSATINNPSGGQTFTRSKKFVTLAENAIRYQCNYDGTPVGALFEKDAINHFKNSNDLSASTWTSTALTVVPNVIAGPDGLMTADKFIATSVGGVHRRFASPGLSGLVGSTSYVAWVLAKAAELSRIQFYFGGATISYIRYDLLGFTATKVGGPATLRHGISHVGNGWCLCWASDIIAAGGTANNQIVLDNRVGSDPLNGDDFTGDDVSGVYIAHAQLEKGSVPSSLITTGAVAAARAQNSASFTMPTEFDFNQCSIAAVIRVPNLVAGEIKTVCVLKNDTNNSLKMRFNGTALEIAATILGVAHTQTIAGLVSGTRITVAAAIDGAVKKMRSKASGVAAPADLTIVGTYAVAPTTLDVCHDGNTLNLDEAIEKIMVVPRSFTATEISGLTG